MQPFHRLLAGAAGAIAAFAALGHLHILKHLLQRIEHFLRFGHATLLHQLFDLAHHLVEVGHRHFHALAILLGTIFARFGIFGELLHVVIHRLAQLLHELGDFFVAGTLAHRLRQAFLGLAQPVERVVEVADLQLHRGIPQDLGHLVAGFRRECVDRAFQPPDRAADLQKDTLIKACFGVPCHCAQESRGAGRVFARPQDIAAHFDQRIGQGIEEPPPRQARNLIADSADLARRIGDRQHQRDGKIGQGML